MIELPMDATIGDDVERGESSKKRNTVLLAEPSRSPTYSVLCSGVVSPVDSANEGNINSLLPNADALY